MKYITLFLLIAVFLYGIRNAAVTRHITAFSSVYANELPIYCVDTDQPVVALTFDSAWGTEDLDQILSILKKHNAPAVFFVTGEWARKNPDAIIAIDKAGHEIANHGDTHKHMPQLSKEEMAAEIQGCHNAVYELIGKDMTLFRAPYSDWNDDVVEVSHAMGYSAINQSVDSLDWKDYGIDSIIRTVCEHKNLENGSIILLHNGATYTKDALDVMLTKLEEQGYSFVKVSDLIYTSDYYLDHTGKQFSKNSTSSTNKQSSSQE
ncbi:MAG: polysaccharide deacetylase family protein [Lachnospiraceae bacterium]